MTKTDTGKLTSRDGNQLSSDRRPPRRFNFIRWSLALVLIAVGTAIGGSVAVLQFDLPMGLLWAWGGAFLGTVAGAYGGMVLCYGFTEMLMMEVGVEPSDPHTAAWKLAMPMALVSSSIFAVGPEWPQTAVALAGGLCGLGFYAALMKRADRSSEETAKSTAITPPAA